jgi:myosin V
MAHSYDVGTRAWQPDSAEGWIASEVESKTVDGDNVKLVFLLSNGEVFVQRQRLSAADGASPLMVVIPAGENDRDNGGGVARPKQ